MAPAPPPAPAPAPAPSPAETLPAPPPESAPTPPPAETTPTPPAEDAAPEAAEAPAEEAAAEPAADEAAPESPTDPPAEPPAEPVVDEAAEPAAYRVTEEQWQAALEQPVTVERDDAEPIHGKLVATTEAAAVIVADDGDVHTLRKADVSVVTIDDVPEAAEPEAVPAQDPPAEEAADPPAKKDEEDWKKFGVFTSHGISYAHWRTEPYQAGAAAYAGDLGVGYNWRRAWGAYLVLGGHAGARLVRRTIKGNFGHLAGMVRYRGKKRFVAMGGLALAWSKLDEPERRVRDVAVSIPLRVMAQFKVADSLYLAMGVGYEPGFFAQGRIANALSLQATLAHW